jgi:hypothetical protein
MKKAMATVGLAAAMHLNRIFEQNKVREDVPKATNPEIPDKE